MKMQLQRKTTMNHLILITFNTFMICASTEVVTKQSRDKREIQRYDIGNAENYYSHFNQGDDVKTTPLPLLDPDVNVVAHIESSVPRKVDNKANYFRDFLNDRIHLFQPNDEFISTDTASENIMDIRGKKFLSFYPLRFNPKRAPSGFLGLRGKKYFYDDMKRAPLGFTGMRGKKSDTMLNNDFNLYQQLLKASSPSYALNDIYSMEDNGRIYDDKENINELGDDDNIDEYMLYQSAGKRAPSGFLGLRGKKRANQRYDVVSEKRAPSGFLGLRGKRADYFGKIDVSSELDN